MRRFIKSVFLASTVAAITWFVTADHYGRILTGTPGMGLGCRMNGLQTVWYGKWGERTAYCVDLENAVPEQDVWRSIRERNTKKWEGTTNE